ncbi:hypothetical protein HY523_01960, partial [Candidatus Berkelbacteria bacterium]|nr:hypothetical protein [Candidatus Berkelbacteria bacterium]
MTPAKWIGWLTAGLAATIPLYLIRFSLGPIQTTAWELLLYCAIGLALITQTLSLKVWQTDPLRWAWLLIAIGGLVSLLLSDNLRVGLGQWKA